MTSKTNREWPHYQAENGTIFHDALGDLSHSPVMPRSGYYVASGISEYSLAWLAPVKKLVSQLGTHKPLVEAMQDLRTENPVQYDDLIEHVAYDGLVAHCEHTPRQLRRFSIRQISDEQAGRLAAHAS